MASKIEWTEQTWNPVAGCSLVSTGCKNCYAMRCAHRLQAAGIEKYRGTTELVNGHPVWTGRLNLDEQALRIPLRRKKPTMFFVNSMSDLFHENLSDADIDRIFAVMSVTPEHVYQVLTKRPQRMAEYMSDIRRFYRWGLLAAGLHPAPKAHADMDSCDNPANIWLGVSVENQATADERIPHLLRCPAAVRFLSCEPLLGPIDLTSIKRTRAEGYMRPLDGRFNTIHWVIVGGESGPDARPMHPDWARSIRDQCVAAKVPFFFKQWGEYEPVTPLYDGHDDAAENGRGDLVPVDRQGVIWEEWQPNDPRTYLMERVGKQKAGRQIDGRELSEFPKISAEC